MLWQSFGKFAMIIYGSSLMFLFCPSFPTLGHFSATKRQKHLMIIDLFL